MDRVTGAKILIDIEDRFKKIGDPAGMTMREVVNALGYPQYEFMSLDWVLEDKPYLLIWDTGKRFIPLEFSYDLKCIGVHKELKNVGG